MRMHQVEVDEEVFSLVKKSAEPLVDTFNSVLRRLLLEDPRGRVKSPSRSATTSSGGGQIPSLPNGIPQALRQILAVAQLVRGGAYSRTAATQFVAKYHHVAPQTVLDKYCRQLGLTANRFDRLLEQDPMVDLPQILRSKFPEHAQVINAALG